MAFPLLRSVVFLLVLNLLLLAQCRADSGDAATVIDPPSTFSRLHQGIKTLWKRRRGGSSDSSSPGDSESSDESEDNSGGGWYTCTKEVNRTQDALNPQSYGSYYRHGHGSLNDTSGGYTPQGSGTPPFWDNRTGTWVATGDRILSYLDDSDYLTYLGGASVPYPAGEVSPNGVSPQRVDFDFIAVSGLDFVTSNVPDNACDVPNPSYAYKYQDPYNWTQLDLESATYGDSITQLVPVYCCCDLYSVCGCDDFQKTPNFVATMLYELGIVADPRTVDHVCNVTVDGAVALLINGTLANGSTKADPSLQPSQETVLATVTQICTLPTGGSDAVSSADRVHGPSPQRAFFVAWTAVIVLGLGLGMAVILL